MKKLIEYTKEELDKMTITELVALFENNELVTVEGYGGENKLGFAPEYVTQRVRKELEYLENSDHPYNTWDTYNLYLLPDDKAVMYIMNAKSRGGSVTLKIVEYKTLKYVSHHVDWELTNKLKKQERKSAV